MPRPTTTLALAARGLRRSPLRSTALVLCGGLTAALVVGGLNYAAAGRQQVLAQLAAMGSNLLTVSPRLSRSVGGRARTGAIVTTLRADDLEALRRAIPAIAAAAPVASANFLVKAGDLSKNGAAVVGVGAGYFALRRWPLAQGSGFGPAELRRRARVALAGAGVERQLWGGASPLGQRLFINRVPFRVIGVLAERGQRLDAVNEDDQVYIPLTTAMTRLMNRDYFSALFLAVDPPGALVGVQQQATRLLRQRHRLLASQPDDFQVQSQQTLIATQAAASLRLRQWIGASGGGGLLLASLAILALNWLAVGARASEVGLRRALGATGADIFRLFFGEAALLALAMAALAAAAAWSATRLALAWGQLPWRFDPAPATAVIALSVALNLGFALLPARRAARLDPAQTMAG